MKKGGAYPNGAPDHTFLVKAHTFNFILQFYFAFGREQFSFKFENSYTFGGPDLGPTSLVKVRVKLNL